MWPNVIEAKLISRQCIDWSVSYVGWPQGLAFSCAGMSASVTILAVVCTTDLCGLIAGVPGEKP